MLGLRALLGFTEAIVAPANLALSVMWYKKSEQPLIIACYQAMLGLSTIISGLYAYGGWRKSRNQRGPS